MNLFQQLKHATQELHTAIEGKMHTDKIYTGTLTTREYTHLLVTHFLFHASLEKEIANRPHDFHAYDSQSRIKTSALQKDFHDLHIHDLPPLETHFSQWSFGKLLGACYVAEGSMLGGKVIAKHLRTQGWKEPENYFYFLNFYGEQTGDKWKSFLQFLATHATDEEEILQGALDAYRIFDTEASRVDFFLQSRETAVDMPVKKLLVYDDDPDMIELLRRVLRKGYTIEGYTTTTTLLETIGNYQPDAILIDYYIGETESAQAIYQIKHNATTAHIPVYLFSGHLKLEEIAQTLPVAGYISKPFSLKELRDYLATQLK